MAEMPCLLAVSCRDHRYESHNVARVPLEGAAVLVFRVLH